MAVTLNENIQKIETSLIRRFNDMAVKQNAELFLTLGEPAFDTPASVKEACVKALYENKTHYGPNFAKPLPNLKERKITSIIRQTK